MRLAFPRRPGAWAATLALVTVLTASGCGQTGTVSGKVLLKGAPVKGGMVTFIHQAGGTSITSGINEDGSYSIPKISTGQVKICVDTEVVNPAKKPKTPSYGPPPGAGGKAGYDPSGGGPSAADLAKRYVKIRSLYANPDTTDLKYVVTAGNQNFDIPLQ